MPPWELAAYIVGGLVVILLAVLLMERISVAATQVKVATSQAQNAAHTVPPGALGISLVGRSAPDVTFTAWTVKDGQQVSLKSLRGHPVILNFWDSTCYPCQLEAPLFVQANKTYAAKGVIFVGVSFHTSKSDGLAFLRQHGLTYLAGGTTDTQILVSYSLIGEPDTYFINSAGKIVDQNVGQITQQKMAEGIAQALK
jgi:cytochrome c biogenesis protein CcmG/thiol:disulfide interchange protein DsbE